ncbi:MAG: GNAT family N-acetyltransferase [Blastocatellia bacterium]|nr:GNAT family N-acetyltransferase [Blastocatellia bacterium]
MDDTLSFTFRKARAEEAAFLVPFVNAAYRGDSSRVGWTTEAEYLDGQRTDEDGIRELIETEHSMILLCLQNEDIVGSVHLQKTEDAAYLGMLVTRPDLQGHGIGKHLMQAAEAIVQQEWGVRKMEMTVITLRSELIAFYERRGYRRTGIIKPFPTDVRFGIPRVEGLQFEVLEKELEP